MHTYTHGHTHSQSHFLLCWIPMTTEQAESMLNIPAWCVHHGPIMIQLGQFSSEDQPIIDLHLFSDPQFSLSLSLSLCVQSLALLIIAFHSSGWPQYWPLDYITQIAPYLSKL